MTKEIQTKCGECGSERIWLEETLGWKCYIDPETGSLNCKNSTNEISSINCLDCGEVFDYDYDNEINFD
jgi:hypothetical protein